jgi:hypothetical protein
METENVHFHVLKLFPFPLTTQESGSTVLYETRLALAETRDVGRDKVFGAHPFPWFAGSGCCEGALALNAPGEGLLLGAHARGWRTAGYRGRGKIEELMGRHAKCSPSEELSGERRDLSCMAGESGTEVGGEMQGGNNLIGNRLRRGRLGRQTREQPRRRGKRGRRRKRSGRGETFYLGEECMIYVRVKKRRKENMPT